MADARPTSVKAGFVDFAIRYLNEEEWTKRFGVDSDDSGNMNGHAGVISIRDAPDMHPVHVREVLLHEILHACAYASARTFETYRMLEDIEETFVRRINVVLIDVLRSNPDVTKFLTS